jgi:SAM-dependent methyltransferase
VTDPSDYRTLNREHWNANTDVHWQSEFYDVEGWLAGAESLREIELSLLPDDLTGAKVLHLQCHFGQDTLSLARRGARVTGVDLSDRAIARARQLAELASLPARFVESDVYELPRHLDEAGTFDLVFTTYGTIGWLPDLDRWAEVIHHFVAPGGALVFAEFHPIVWTLNRQRDGFEYSYFNRGPIVEQSASSYTGRAKVATTEVGWNHALGDVLTALLRRGLVLERFSEHDFSPWNCFPDSVAVGPQRYQLAGLEGMLPLTYALRARK